MSYYSPERKAALLKKLLPPISLSVPTLSSQEGVSRWTHGQLPGRDFNPLDLLLLLRTDRPNAVHLMEFPLYFAAMLNIPEAHYGGEISGTRRDSDIRLSERGAFITLGSAFAG